MKLVNLLRETGRVITYRPQLAKLFGGVVAEIFFEQIFYWQGKSSNSLGVYKTQEELTEETGLSRKEQETARRKLREIGVLEETHKRLEHRIYYKIDEMRLNEILSDLINKTDDNSGSDNSSFANGQNEQSRMSKSSIREEPKRTFVNTLDYNNRLHTNNNPLPPKGESAIAEQEHHSDLLVERKEQSSLKQTKSILRIDYESVKDLFNQANQESGGRLPEIMVINEERKRKIKKFMGELKEPTLQAVNNYFQALFEQLKEFHFGENPRQWRANFDWAIRPSTVVKVREEAL